MKITKQSLIYLSFCLSGILIYVLAGLLPLWGEIKENRNNINLLRARLETHKEAWPVYQNLKKSVGLKESPRIPLPAPGKLPRDEIVRIKPLLRELAQTNKLTAELVDPDLEALLKGAPSILITNELKGDLFNFRNYLLGLYALPYFRDITELQIKQATTGLTYKLKFYIEVS